MNKKNLSVVMAGAMLATSVAPVLADSTTGTEIAYDQLKVFKTELLAKMEEKKISDNSIFKTASNPFVSTAIQTELAANDSAGEFSSAYGIKITGKDGKVKLDTTYTTDSAKGLSTALDSLESGDKVELYERETNEFYGVLLPGSKIEATSLPVKYKTGADGDFDTDATTLPGTSASTIYNDDITAGQIKITSSAIVDTVTAKGTSGSEEQMDVKLKKETKPTSGDYVTLTLDDTWNKIDGRLPLTSDNKLLDPTKVSDVNSFDHFGNLVNWKPATENDDKDKNAVLKATYTIGEQNADPSKETLNLTDLYDGIALTAKGTEISADLKNAKDAAEKEGETHALVQIDASVTTDATTNVHLFKIYYFRNSEDAKNTDNAIKTITVVSNDGTDIKALRKLLADGGFKVGVVGGNNRYETAVNVAKQQGIDGLNSAKIAKGEQNIVLVNGMSLVDGLAAAPLAAEKGCFETGNSNSAKAAPLLLTETDKLPTATKEYLEKLVDGFTVTQKKAVTVHLVGGTSVLSSSLSRELQEMGFSVERHGGDNREETSVAVAEELTNASKKAFIVGANGEADAMSISAVAAKDKTPIIVSKVGGVSSDALGFLKENAITDATIIGGEKVVSKEDETKLNKSLTNAVVTRVAGDNRFETNNEIIKTYYTSSPTALVAVKDGINSKDELIDALSAANYAASKSAPIILASSKVTDAQKNNLLNVMGTVTDVVQVGIGADQSVLRTLASLWNVKNTGL